MIGTAANVNGTGQRVADDDARCTLAGDLLFNRPTVGFTLRPATRQYPDGNCFDQALS